MDVKEEIAENIQQKKFQRGNTQEFMNTRDSEGYVRKKSTLLLFLPTSYLPR